MKALTVHGPGDVRLEDRAPLRAGPGELVVGPDLVGLCGTDLEIIDGAIDPAYVNYPVAIGHEWTGIVAGDCARCAVGQANLCATYDEIGFTRDGAAASQILVPAAQAHLLDDSVAPTDAVLAEPASVVYRALSKAGLSPGSRVLVLGDGTIALLCVMLARLWSPAQIAVLGLRAEQAELAKSAGATSFGLADSQAGDQPDAGPDGFDLVVEAAGATSAVQAAVTRARRGGTVLLIGLPPHGETVPLAAADIVNNDLRIVGSFSYTPEAWRGVLALLNSGQLKPGILITHRHPLADWEQAIATLRGSGRPGPRGKVLIDLRKA